MNVFFNVTTHRTGSVNDKHRCNLGAGEVGGLVHFNGQCNFVFIGIAGGFSNLTDGINTINFGIGTVASGPSITIIVAIDNVGVSRCTITITSAIALYRQHVERQ